MTTFVDAFSGAGGLSLGLQSAGWEQLLAIDDWPDALLTYKSNFPQHRVLKTDIKRLTPRLLAGHLDCEPEWIVGGPPCQGFSTVGRRQRTDPRNQLVDEFRKLVADLKPTGFLIENVVGLRDMRFVEEIVSSFRELGYSVTPLVLKSADFGVPQLRRRIFFAGHRDAVFFVGPAARTSPASYTTVWDAIGDLPELEPGEKKTSYEGRPLNEYQRKLRRGSTVLQGHVASAHPADLVRAISFIPDGGNRRDIPVEYQPRSGYHNSYSRLSSAAPAVAVTQNMGKPSGTRCIHPFQNRGLTAREGARLQGFPDKFHFSGGMMSQRLQIANAVSPILASCVGEALVDPKCWLSSIFSPEQFLQTGR